MTLTETAALTKKLLLGSGIFFVVVVMSWIGFQYYYYKIYLPSIPPKIEKPDVKFGNLPKIGPGKSSASSSNYSYALDTDTGGLPAKTPAIVKVYPIAQLSTDLLALDRAKELAVRLGFKKATETITSTQYKLKGDGGEEIVINLDNGNFSFRRPLASASADTSLNNNFTDPDKITEDFKNYLNSRELLNDQLKNGRTTVTYDRQSKNESQTASIYLWQDDINKLPVVTNTYNGLTKAVISRFSEESKKYISLDYIYWPTDQDNAHTYPIITPDQAFEKLKNGEAAVVIQPTGSSVSLTKVYLAYLLTDEYEPYLQPVFVFEGTNFFAYVAAVTPDNIEK